MKRATLCVATLLLLAVSAPAQSARDSNELTALLKEFLDGVDPGY